MTTTEPSRSDAQLVRVSTNFIVENVLGCKWTLSILDALEKGVRRPGALQRSIAGLSTKVMNERLAKLQRFGLIQRQMIASKPLHVEYRLNRQGRALLKIIRAVRSFAATLEPSSADQVH
jgi:DNA-binding HxlR family transcriptional regulator